MMVAKEEKTSMSAHVLPPGSKIQPTYLSWRRRSRRNSLPGKMMRSKEWKRFMACSGWEILHIFTLESLNKLLAWRSPGDCWVYKPLQSALFLPTSSTYPHDYSPKREIQDAMSPKTGASSLHVPSSNCSSFQKNKTRYQAMSWVRRRVVKKPF